ncbi:MAG TPA: DUF6644 family protein [Burkholderiales bacterium]|nr:DUF6644 family protein [Burkholderiales bacterium]
MEHPVAAGPIAALENAPLALAMRHELWLYPAVEIVHIWGFVVLVGSIVVLDLRLLGVSRSISARALSRHVLPWTFGALIFIVPTGLLMFIAHASDLIDNRAFQLKLALLGLAGVNAAIFHTGAGRTYASWDRDVSTPAGVKAHAAASLVIWAGVISCGRLLAYV